MAARLRGMRGRQHVAMKPLSLAPFWVTNRALIQTHVENCQRIIGYRFRDPGLIREALTPFGSRNQRLAIAGDKVADLQLAARWYDSKGRLTPLQWELMKRALLSNTNLASVCFRLRIQDCTLSPCSTDRSMATTIEAIIGAVWLDSKRDLAAVASVMDRFGLTRHPLLPSPSPSTITANQPPCEIRSSRPLSNCFFIGHHLALLQLLFSHGQSFMVQQGTGRRSHLPWRAQRRDKGTERLPTAPGNSEQQRQ
ncbi:ribonuclease III domain-containing protein [Diaporthe sp. PMI_573]|nr:ribonuclease III domain-containing protein [Diaporthaceae sp. PMI_573]